MTRKFESHLTAPISRAATVNAFASNVAELPNPAGTNLKFSQIDGDAQMGAKPYCYLTGYDTDGARLLKTMQDVSKELAAMGVETLRIKVEEIIYDTKTGHDVLTVF